MDAKKILYAEDNEDDAFILQLAVKRAQVPHKLYCADDGEVVISWLKGEGDYANREKYPLPDLLILDLKMPRMSGFDVLEWLRENPTFHALPVVVMSSSDDPSDIKRSGELGAAKYVKKSATCEEIIEHMKTL